ncbi:tripartite tricarboxylate transporter TctB family protein [Oceaniglobus roseus]|uniref:tripartite tricarboxylate transporter TctB family protein n=1 Tax=Oceaniglobus roseus TaxID=1737570 RepID=UPI000C7E9535|nr:tripartite tricarboxylate transporter TctB family protein [Kandeliimicrobium roseum]
MSTKPRDGRRALGAELIIPVLAVVFTLYFFSSIWHSPWTAKVSAFMVGGILLLVCAIFFIRCALWIREGSGTLGFGTLFSRDDIATGRIGLFATTVGYCVLIGYLGFTLTTFLFLALSMIILAKGRNIGFITLISAVMALGGWAVFIWAFDTRFPRGWFETTMKAVLSNG